jgi:hypothetical protein
VLERLTSLRSAIEHGDEMIRMRLSVLESTVKEMRSTQLRHGQLLEALDS